MGGGGGGAELNMKINIRHHLFALPCSFSIVALRKQVVPGSYHQ